MFPLGDLLVEGIIEGKYTGVREVNSDADIFIQKKYQKEKYEPLIQENVEKTGKEEKNVEIYFNKFKIIFNKGVTNFKKYDTMRTYKKVKLFSNYYLPVEIVKITVYELETSYITYTEKELVDKISNELQEEIKKENNIVESVDITYENNFEKMEEGVKVNVICTVEEKIGTKG